MVYISIVLTLVFSGIFAVCASLYMTIKNLIGTRPGNLDYPIYEYDKDGNLVPLKARKFRRK